jgi:hypothetical protein
MDSSNNYPNTIQMDYASIKLDSSWTKLDYICTANLTVTVDDVHIKPGFERPAPIYYVIINVQPKFSAISARWRLLFDFLLPLYAFIRIIKSFCILCFSLLKGSNHSTRN